MGSEAILDWVDPSWNQSSVTEHTLYSFKIINLKGCTEKSSSQKEGKGTCRIKVFY